MKFVSTFLAVAGTALAAPGDPGSSAIGFLEKVRSGTVSLEPGADTAISTQVTDRKRNEIKRRLSRMARDLGGSHLEVGPVKVDEDLAAVLIRKIGGFDPSRLQVFPIGLIRRGESWQATPVPASFENTNVSYSTSLRPRAAALEHWMLKEQVIDLEHLREDAESRLRRSIGKQLGEGELRGFTSEQAAARFLSACARHSLSEILGLLGGLSSPLPSNWPERLRLAEAAIDSPAEAPRPWRLLTSSAVLRLPVFHDQETDGSSAIHSVACLDPAGTSPRSSTGRIDILHLPVSREGDGLWRVNLPQEFQVPSGESQPVDAREDASLLDLFPSKFSSAHPPQPAASAQQARDALIAALQNRNAPAWAPLMHLQGDPARQREACTRGARIWWDAAGPAVPRLAEPIDFIAMEDRAAMALQFFDARNPDRTDIRVLHFQKTGGGWLWNPLPSDEILAAAQAWVDGGSRNWQESWREKMLQPCPGIDTRNAAAAPGPEEASLVVSSFLRSAASSDIRAALGHTARLVLPDSGIALLRNLGHEVTAFRPGNPSPEVVSTHSAGSITAVSTLRASDGRNIQTLYPVVATASGPRILLEIDLIASRGRDFLNRTALDRLRKTDPSTAEQLAAILAELQAKSPDPETR